MTLIVKLQDGGSGVISIPEGMNQETVLNAFLNRQGPFSTEWVQLGSGEYVRHSFIVSVRPGSA